VAYVDLFSKENHYPPYVIQFTKLLANPHTRLETMLEKLRKQTFRITPQRIAVLKILALSNGHPNVETIYQKVRKDFPTTSLATVYKTVTLLKELDEVLELGFAEGSNRYDGNKPYPHPRLICTKCKKIIDPDLASLAHITRELVADTGFQITSHRLDFFGICPDCQKDKD
jgi:Fur family peroxide stress response transcriptional regulator